MPCSRVTSYLARRACLGPWRLEMDHPGPYSGAIIVPALAEASTLPALFESLCSDPSLSSAGLLVTVVVNHRESAPRAEMEDNIQTLKFLRRQLGTLPFPLGIVDAASPGFALPEKDAGVGLARKLGHDLLLPHLDFSGRDPLMISLDADTFVSAGYAGAIMDHFHTAQTGGAVIPFCHRVGNAEDESLAIQRYELFLRCYVAGLAYAQSPYAFHTIGSAMACRASAYLKCGGMNRRRAGEDFYFLQALAKTSGVSQVTGTMVHPSPRRSQRVPFGTGRAIGQLLDGDPGAVLFYTPECFHLLRDWLQMAKESCATGSSSLPDRAAKLSSSLYRFLCENSFASFWERLLNQHQRQELREKAFHTWFDAFRTMKLFHFFAEKTHPRAHPAAILGDFPEAWGEKHLTMAERLNLLRTTQGSAVTSTL